MHCSISQIPHAVQNKDKPVVKRKKKTVFISTYRSKYKIHVCQLPNIRITFRNSPPPNKFVTLRRTQ